MIRATLTRTLAHWQAALAVTSVALAGLLGWALHKGPSVPAPDVIAMPANENVAPSAPMASIAKMPAHAVPARPAPSSGAPPAPPALVKTAPESTMSAASATAKASPSTPTGVRLRPRRAPPPAAPAPRRINY